MLASALDLLSVAEEVAKAVGFELVVFAMTLALALFFRNAGGGKVSKTGFDEVPMPKLRTSAAEGPKLPPRMAVAGVTSVATPEPGVSAGPGHQGPAAILDEIVNSVREESSFRWAGRALQLYYKELRPALGIDGLRIREIARLSESGPTDMFATLVHCAIRLGKHHLVEGLLDDMVEHAVHRPLSFYESAMKQLAGQKQYHLALAVHDRLTADGLHPSTVTCSCLIVFAAEVGELQRAVEFFEKLSATATPSIRAYMTIIRVHARRKDFNASVKVLQDMHCRGAGVDSLALNVVLATGVATNQIEACTKLMIEADSRGPPVTDVVSFNTIVKGYAQRNDSAGAFQMIDQMRVRGLSPNIITFNTGMDAAVRSGDVEGAWKLFTDMQESGLRPDKITCSIIVKSLIKAPRAQRVQEVLALLKEVDSTCDPTLKSKLYHTLLDAAMDAIGQGAGLALQTQVFAQMRAQKVAISQGLQRQVQAF